MTTVAPAAKKPKLSKREPVAIITAAVTLIGTFMYVAPGLGLAIPDSVAKVITLILFIAAGLGIRPLVTPVAAPKLTGKAKPNPLAGH
jgi:hypothetical protein